MQNADIAWNTLYQSPFAQPSIGTNRNASAAAPSPSMTAVPISASRISRTMPPTLKEATLSCKIVRWRRPIRLPIAMETSASSVITPKPPIWMAAISTTCPKSDQCVPVSTSTCPVTQTALVAVNSAVSGGVTVRLCDEIGSMSSSVTNRISSAKPMAIISDGLIGASLFFLHPLPPSKPHHDTLSAPVCQRLPPRFEQSLNAPHLAFSASIRSCQSCIQPRGKT